MSDALDLDAGDTEAAPEAARRPRDDTAAALPAAAIFDPAWYAATYGLGERSAAEAWEHFATLGLGLGYQPSPLVAPSFVRRHAPEFARIETVDELVAALLAVRADALAGWSPRIMPAWVALQLGPRAVEAASGRFAGLLSATALPASLSPHPGLRATPRRSAWTSLGQALADLVSDPALAAASRVDLGDYAAQHRDLSRLRDDPGACFDHLWTEGYAQNRLKHLGISTHQWMPDEFRLRFCIQKLLDGAVRDRLALDDAAQGSLPTGPVAQWTGDPAVVEQVTRYDPRTRAEPPSLPALLAFAATADSAASHILAGAEGAQAPDAPAAPMLLARGEILDRDLLGGRVRERTQRVVYSINIGSYDAVPVPPELEGSAFYLISDARRIPAASPWRLVRPTLTERDRKRLCLWYKTHPHRLFPDARHSVWIDGNVECLPGSDRVLVAQEALAEVATFQHPDRSCIYVEAEEIIRLGLDDADRVRAVVARLREAGMPERNGLFETNVLYAKPNDYAVARFLDTWWRNIFLGSRRDQMSFTFAAFLTGIEISPLEGRNSAKTSRFFRKRPHRNPQGRLL